MNLRGRLTLFAAVAALLAGAAFAQLAEVATVEPPLVSTPPPPLPAAAPEELLRRLPPGARGASVGSFVNDTDGRVVESVPIAQPSAPAPEFFRVHYSVDPELSLAVERILQRGRVALGHVLLMDVESGRLLAYESTDPAQFPATHAYPMASIMKVVTAAGLLRLKPEKSA